MYIDSERSSPIVSVFLSRSEPARSTRLSLHRVTTPDESTRERIRRWTVKMAWPRVELRLSWWLAICRLVWPSKSSARASSSDATGWWRRFFTEVAALVLDQRERLRHRLRRRQRREKVDERVLVDLDVRDADRRLVLRVVATRTQRSRRSRAA